MSEPSFKEVLRTWLWEEENLGPVDNAWIDGADEVEGFGTYTPGHDAYVQVVYEILGERRHLSVGASEVGPMVEQLATIAMRLSRTT